MPTESYCPLHGPYDASLGECPYPHDVVKDTPPSYPNWGDESITGYPEIPLLDRPSPSYGSFGSASKFRTEEKGYKPRVFISSTFSDLKEYREAAFKAIHNLFGYSDDMLFWSADERNAATVSIDRVKQCDLVILILAHRYGFIPANSKYSVTEMEYRAARDANIPVLAFFVDEQTPWPPNFVETGKQKELSQFKSMVEKDVVRSTFHTQDELFALITQAMHHFIERNRKLLEARKLFTSTLLTKSYNELETQPDMVLQIGASEDDLPLLLNVKRSKHLTPHLDQLANLVSTYPGDRSADELLDTFQISLEKHAARSWASKQIYTVHLKNGQSETMYVTERNLSELTSSLLSRIMKVARGRIATRIFTPQNYPSQVAPSQVGNINAPAYEDDLATDLGYDQTDLKQGDDADIVNQKVESFGGLNRFLGISLKNGKLYSVGYETSRNWVEWHPYYSESIFSNFPDCKIRLYNQQDSTPSSYAKNLEESFIQGSDEAGTYYGDITLLLERQSVGRVINQIAEAVARMHSLGNIHGDLKPSNILLTKGGPFLIDDFNLKENDRSPGWTPNWSAPEQAMREPVSYRTDVYSLGLLVVNLLSGHLVGEVRKFRIPDVRNHLKEHDVFYNPSIYIQEQDKVFTSGNNEWLTFAKSCLLFEQGKRPDTLTFIRQLTALLKRFPLQGNLELNLTSGKIVAATLLGGEKRVARLLSEIE